MIDAHGAWTKLGPILVPDRRREWMATYTGPSFAVAKPQDGVVDVYVTGRDTQNRSRIGVATIDPEHPGEPLAVSDAPVFDLGALGAFDENGVSYPWIVDANGVQYMYYVGWMPTVLTPFQNHVGLAIRSGDGPWRRFSRAPILPRTDEEYLSLGSSAVLREYAESADGTRWERPNLVCIDTERPDEYAIGRPSVLRRGGVYHMWYSYRGSRYRVGYAWSEDGVRWNRRDDLAGIDVSSSGWDAESICYSHVFECRRALYMLYCGNHYGRDGLGLAVFRS